LAGTREFSIAACAAHDSVSVFCVHSSDLIRHSSLVIRYLNMPAQTDLLAASCPVPVSDHKEIVLGHGSGGRLSHQLIENLILPQFKNQWLEPLHDGAVFSINGTRLAFSTDSFVVNPIFFPGGDIGSLAVHGTLLFSETLVRVFVLDC